jgi:microcystin-dependent protein
MAQPFIGEIRMFAGNFAPAGWAFCNGQQMPISENDTLFVVIGTTYGGDGQETFNLPDLRGRIPIHQGSGSQGVTFTIGEAGGVEEVTLTTQQTPIHNHALLASNTVSTQTSPANLLLAQSSTANLYISDSPSVPLASSSIGPVGGSQPHTNFQPYLCINFIISLFGLFPSQT